MADVVDLAGYREEPLEDQLQRELQGTGSVTREVDRLTVSADVWRRAARTAGRRLGRPTRTGTDQLVVWAFLADWPADDEEQEKHQRRLREAVEAIDYSSGSLTSDRSRGEPGKQ